MTLISVSAQFRACVAVAAAVLAVPVLAVPVASAGPPSTPRWELTPTGSDARLRGLDVVDRDVVWASGSGGTVLRTVDSGGTWQHVGPPDTASLQFRDIEAFDADRAVVLSIGPGEDSRVYATDDGGRTWTRTFTNDHPDAFYDCLDFFPDGRGLAMSDPVDGRIRVAETDDYGRTWRVQDPATMPPALPGEFAFAASGTCLVTSGGHDAWIATGGPSGSRVFHSRDRGRTWRATMTPVRSGPTAGIYSLAFRDRRHGLAVGGDFADPATAPGGLARTEDAGASWRLVPDGQAPGEYRSGAAWATGRAVLAVGPTGTDLSRDAGVTWHRVDPGSFDAVDCEAGGCWASGQDGRVAVMHWR